MHQPIQGDPHAPEGCVWSLYLSPEDLQFSVRLWAVKRFALLARSPSTTRLVVLATDPKEGRVDFELKGHMSECEGGRQEAIILHSFWAEDLAYTEKAMLVALVREHYPMIGGSLVRKSVAVALGAPVLA